MSLPEDAQENKVKGPGHAYDKQIRSVHTTPRAFRRQPRKTLEHSKEEQSLEEERG
jgi:hypothetical protein